MSSKLETQTVGTRTFDYGIANVRDFAVRSTKSVLPEGAKQRTKGQKTLVQGVAINGEEFIASKRFWTSLQTRFGFSPNIFRYFDHTEVFDRIAERAPNDQIRYCIERSGEKSTLLAVTNPVTATVRYDMLAELFERYGSNKITYADGIVRSVHEPRVGTSPFQIAGDSFMNNFIIDTPIDGFGRPNIYLSLLRLICTNGAIGFSKAFRSEISTGKSDSDVAFALSRAMDGFNNEDGFIAMRQRFDAAANSWASVNEVQKLYRVLMVQGSRGALAKKGKEYVDGQEIETSLPIFQAFDDMSGKIAEIYGLTQLDSLSIKRQRTLPAACKVYDLLNFATEVATHQSQERGNRALQAYVGDLISHEYDLEGTVDAFSDWRDFFVSDENTAATMRLMSDTRAGHIN